MNPNYPIYIGLDLGTSGAKAVALRGTEGAVYSARYPYELLDNSDEQIRELNLADVEKGFDHCWRSVLDEFPIESIAALGLSTAMHSVIGLDRSFRPVTNVLTWADMRGRSLLPALRNHPIRDGLVRHTGTPLHPMSPLLKIRYLETERPGDIRYYADLKSYLVYRLTGQWCIDRSLASATGLWDADTRHWYGPALDWAGIDGFQLPRIVDTEHLFRQWRWEERPFNIPLIIGASDGCLSNYAVLGSRTDAANLTLGTSGALRVHLPAYATRRHENLFCYYLQKDRWVLGGATNNAGNLLTTPLEEFPVQKADLQHPVFLPHHFGERSPVMRFERRSGFYTPQDLTDEEKKELIREGLLFNLRWIREQLEEESGANLRTIFLTGGLAGDRRIVALAPDILDCPVETADLPDSSALGAALLARRAVEGDKAATFHFKTTRSEPEPEAVEKYRQRYGEFKKI